MRRFLLIYFLATFLFALSGMQVLAQEHPLRLGILPYLNVHKLYRVYLPVKRELEKAIGRPVILASAPNYSSFLERTASGEYELVMTAPHFALLAEQESGFRRVARAVPQLQGALIVRKDSEISKVEDLHDRIVAMPDKLALMTLLGESLLKQSGLSAGEDVKVKNVPGVNRSILLVSRGQADAAISVSGVLNSMPAHVQDSLHVLALTASTPHLMFMASPALSESDYTQITESLLSFSSSSAGQRFFRDSRLIGLQEISDSDMADMKDYVELLQFRR
jgi:phosphonate transport system substrate-binding protein